MAAVIPEAVLAELAEDLGVPEHAFSYCPCFQCGSPSQMCPMSGIIYFILSRNYIFSLVPG
jgi:hypothetical protein